MFGEKSHQVKPGNLIAFGIEIDSRYCKAYELIEMINFARLVAEEGISHYVFSVFYDSQACLCTFTLDPVVLENDPIGQKILKAAKESIGQFELFDNIGHRGSDEEEKAEIE